MTGKNVVGASPDRLGTDRREDTTNAAMMSALSMSAGEQELFAGWVL